ncbi:thioredoxin-dependent thiol peroxidase [Nakamurella sp. YIM 132087]|uniref:thioredoxin-dependent peroxiredoxin n=1 Tax=Nakamurella alba TaxID=2665158 RepID=A0A7K1FIW1_9ACTN|nr:thioredoxin-dependent thiol peroxidase [Nakamurella alba]MTD13389.1 thioredoxin-dependent thiol peroxidase [Nakamurella alba]
MQTELPDVGDPAPTFTLPDADGSPVSLADFAGQRVIVYFYPAAMTPGCTTQACDFSAAKGELDTAGYTVLGISPDAPAKLATFAEKSDLSITLLSDADRSVMQAYGAFGEKKNYGKIVQGVIRSTFVVGPDGRIEQAWRNVKATGHVARVLKELGLAA